MNQDKVWNEKVAFLLSKRFKEEEQMNMLKLVSSLVKGESVLDMGCGFAQLSEFIPEDVEYCGVDQSMAMLKVARKMFPKVKLIKGNIYDVDLPKFDTVFAIDFLHHQPVMKEVFEKLISLANKRLVVSLWIWGRSHIERKQYFGHHGEIINWKTKEELKTLFSETKYNIIEKVGRPWRDIYYFDLKGGDNENV